MNKVRYRTEAFSGLQERAAAEVMAFETFELGNVDILETLVSGVLAGRSHEMVERCLQMIDELNRNGFVDDMGQKEKVGFFQEVLSEIERSTGVQVRYALWLADIETVTNREWYGRDMADDLDFDSYEIGPVVLSELGSDGTLYGYPDLPVALEEKLEVLKDQMVDIINAREGVRDSSKRAVWVDELYNKVDNRIQEIEAVLAAKERFVADRRQERQAPGAMGEHSLDDVIQVASAIAKQETPDKVDRSENSLGSLDK